MTDAFFDRYGPIAVVTGASSGIGKAFAENLAAKGFELVVVARRVERLNDLAADLGRKHGTKVKVLQVDLAQRAASRQILDATAGMDIGLVVSNAGFSSKGPHVNADPDYLTDMLMVNCNMAIQMAHDFAPGLMKRGRGGIILTSSVEAMMGCPYSAAYSASKALVNAFGEALWAELKPSGVEVLTLCPGATESEAAAKVGIDIKMLQNVMRAEDVVTGTLENIANGPTYFSSEHYRSQMAHLLTLPRRDALTMMASAMKPK